MEKIEKHIYLGKFGRYSFELLLGVPNSLHLTKGTTGQYLQRRSPKTNKLLGVIPLRPNSFNVMNIRKEDLPVSKKDYPQFGDMAIHEINTHLSLYQKAFEMTKYL